LPKNDASEDLQGKTGKKGKSKKKKTMLILLIILVVLAGSSAAAYLIYFKEPAWGDTGNLKKTSTATSVKNAKVVETETLDMGDMVVNLAGNGGTHYLRVKIIIEYPKEKKLAEELKKNKYQLSDILITALRSKTMLDVSSAESVEELKSSLLKEINNHLENGDASGVYFTDFLLQ
jgi:flagellar FliL protein